MPVYLWEAWCPRENPSFSLAAIQGRIYWWPERIWLQPKTSLLTLKAESSQSPSNGPSNNDETMADGNYLKCVRNEHTLANGLFPSPQASLQRKKARESETLGSAYAFSPLSFPKHPLLSPQDHAWFLNSHQVSGEGEILFLALFAGQEIDAICLPLFCSPSGLDLTEGGNEGVHPAVAHVLWTTQSLHRDTNSETVPIYSKYW